MDTNISQEQIIAAQAVAKAFKNDLVKLIQAAVDSKIPGAIVIGVLEHELGHVKYAMAREYTNVIEPKRILAPFSATLHNPETKQ